MLPKYKLINIDQEQWIGFDDKFPGIEGHHVVLQLSEKLNISEDKISLLLNIANNQRENGMSFVVIQRDIDIDSFPEELNIVPTLQEAEDVLEMEAIERDLGF